MSTTVPKRLYGPAQLTTSAATLYTAPNGGSAIIKHLRASNPTGSDVTFTMSIGADAASTRVYSGVVIPANGSLERFVYYVLNQNEIVQGLAGTGSALVLILDGTETT